MDTSEKLDLLAGYHKEVDIIASDKQKVVDSVLTDELKQKLADIDIEFDGKLSVMNDAIAELEAEIKQDVIHIGKTVPGKFLMAVWNKARVTWDNKGLEGFMVAHPEIVAFRKEGEPSVTIRKNGKGE